MSKLVPLARRGRSFEIIVWVEANSRTNTIGAYSDGMTVPDSPEYNYPASESVLKVLPVSRMRVLRDTSNHDEGVAPA